MKRTCHVFSHQKIWELLSPQIESVFPGMVVTYGPLLTSPEEPALAENLVLVDGEIVKNVGELQELCQKHAAVIFLARESQKAWLNQVHSEALVGFLLAPYTNQEVFFLLNKARHTMELNQTLEHRTSELRRIQYRLDLLVEAAKDVGNYDNLNTLAPRLMEKFVRSMAAEGGTLFLRVPQGLRRIYSLDPGHTPDLIPFPIKHGSPLAQLVEEKKAFLIQDFDTVQTATSGWTGYTGTSGLLLPLLDKKGYLTGAITLHNKQGDPFSEQDKSLGLILAAFCAEVIQSHRAMERLLDSEDRYKELFLEDITANFLADPSGRIILSNPAFQELFETSTAGGTSYVNQFFPDPGYWNSLMEKLDQKGVLKLDDLELKTLGGKSVWVTGKIMVLGHGGPLPAPIQGYFHDITRRKRLEGLMAHSEKMEALGRLAGGVAHDYNNLMTAILGYAELLYDEVHTEQGRQDLEEITKSAERAGHLTRQLLTLGRRDYLIERMNFIPDVSIHNLLGLLKQLIKLPCLLVLELEAPASRIHFNPSQLEQIVINLVINARDSMPEGGTIHLRTALLAAHSPDVLIRPELEPKAHWMMKVSDTGSGIDQSVLPHIFEPFFSTKDQGKGTGLGLATVYNGVQSGGGSIEVESTLGIGTDFTLYFPVEEAHVHEHRPVGT